jgi:hypothetical protein
MALTSSSRGSGKTPTWAILAGLVLLAAAIAWASTQPSIPINEPGHFSPAPSVSAS